MTNNNKYKPLQELRKEVIDNDYNKWACDMLELIANDMWLEESETRYFYLFYKDVLWK